MSENKTQDSAIKANKMVQPAMEFLIDVFKGLEVSIIMTDKETPGCLLFTNCGRGESSRKYLAGKILDEDPLGYISGVSNNGNIKFNEEEH